MFVVQRASDGARLGIDTQSKVSHARDEFQDNGVVGGCPRIRPPRKRRMIGHQNRRNHGVVDVAKRADNGVPGVLFVILRDFGVFQFYRDGNRSMEGIRVGGAKARNRSARLCPGGFLPWTGSRQDRKSTRLNSSHPSISYAVFCLKKKKI